jgi:CubicO group peptidase (beta-lactamase class C family)
MRTRNRSLVIAALATGLCAVALGAQAPAPTDALTPGLWGRTTVFGPQVRGQLLLERDGSIWTLRAGGFDTQAAEADGLVQFRLPGDLGELRLVDPRSLAGPRAYWIQPQGMLGRYSTPVRLTPAGPGRFTGDITPLDERFSLYLLMSRASDGSLNGVLRNPEMNWNGGAPSFTLSVKDEALVFTDPRSGKQRYAQPYDAGQRRITFDFGAPFVLVPLGRDEAAGFYPRTPAPSSPYVYRAPATTDDGWTTTRAGDVGLDGRILASAVHEVLGFDSSDPAAPRLHSLLVARHGKLVLEEYFHGFAMDVVHDLRSASKTFTSVMAGVAMDRGAALTPATLVVPLLEDARVPSIPKDARRTITLGHLLTHTSGLSCDDNDERSPGNEDVMQAQRTQPDWYRYTLSLPLLHEPGTTYAYCSAGINLAGGAIAAATRSWLPDFFDRHVASPLQIARYHVNLMPTGQAYSAGGIYMRPRDFMKFGQVYLDGGLWRGRRLVSRTWVSESTAAHVTLPDGATDGYAWHRHTLEWRGKTYQEFEASGNGGQFLVVVPELDLVVVMTAGNYGQFQTWRRFRDEFLPRWIVAAVSAAGR